MLSSQEKATLDELLGKIPGLHGSVANIKSEGGGSINECYSFQFGERKLFLKKNSESKFPGMFSRESDGLKELITCKLLIVPQPVLVTAINGNQFLVMEHLEKVPDTSNFYRLLGEGLAALHSISGKDFGFSESNYIGSLKQSNERCGSWREFFVTQRLEPLVKWCYDEKLIESGILRSFESLYLSLDEIFPKEKPALLHGDLWSGNKMNTTGGPALFDPAVYFGHREMDIAMTMLFGGFSTEFYEAYNAILPLEKDYQKRTGICNLYPLLVHVKLFGTSYLRDVLQTIRKF